MRVDIHWVAWRWAPAAGARGEGTKSRSVGCGLRAELSQIEIGTSTVTLSHGLPELSLGPEAVEDDTIDDNAEKFDYDLDDAADKCPVLKSANKCIGNVVLEDMSSGIVYARPAPHVFVVVLRFTLIENGCSDSPHNDAEDEETNGEDSVVGGYFFGSIVTSSKVGNHNDDRHD